MHDYIPSQVIPFPVYPWLHVQMKLPGVLVHVASESQLLVALAHSLLSGKTIITLMNIVNSQLPMQTTPFPVYPWLHTQLNPPGVL